MSIGAGIEPGKFHHQGFRPTGNDGVFFQLIVIGGGSFWYDSNQNLRRAIVEVAQKDPIQGITCQPGESVFNGHGAVISLYSSFQDAQLWYADNGNSAQGALVASVAVAAGTDPFSNPFLAGVQSYGGAGSVVAGLLTSALQVTSQAANTRVTTPGQITLNDATTDGQAPAAVISSPQTTAGGDTTIRVQGESKDATVPAQIQIGAPAGAGTTDGVVEIQGKTSILQKGNANALFIKGNNTAVLPQLLVTDFLGNTILGAGIIGVYGVGDPFVCYASFGFAVECMTITPLANGLTGSHSGGKRTLLPALSPFDSISPVSGTTYLNWQGLQDGWSGVDHAMYLQVQGAGTCQVDIGQAPILGTALVSGNTYTTIALKEALNFAIANGTTVTLMNGDHGQNASQTVTLSAGAAIGDTSLSVNSFMANANYPAFTSAGNNPTTWMIVNAASGTFPWNITPIVDVLVAGQQQSVHWHIPTRWWFKVTGSGGLTIGSLHGYAA